MRRERSGMTCNEVLQPELGMLQFMVGTLNPWPLSLAFNLIYFFIKK